MHVPAQARVVVCGGGIIGASVAYHLAKKGCNDVVLLEQGSLGCGTTWHAVGLVGRLKSSTAATKLCEYSASLYAKLEQETGVTTGWKESGSLAVARTKERMTVFRRLAGLSKAVNINAELVSREDCHKLNQFIRLDDVQGGLWIPNDGVVNPSDVCHSLARGATQQGVKIIEKVQVEKVLSSNGSVSAVVTNKGQIRCEYFVNCAGQWSYWLGLKCDHAVPIPLHPTEHLYVVSKPIEGISPMFPTVRDPDGLIFGREWSGGLCAGGFERNAKPCLHHGIPDKFEFQLLPEDWDQFRPLLDEILHRFPIIENAEIRQMINGPESFTPDGNPILGEALDVRNYFVAAGLSSFGIAFGGGVGKVVAEWIIDGRPSINVWSLDLRRFAVHHSNRRFLQDRVTEVVSGHYSMPWPKKQYTTSRGVRWSPLAPRLQQLGPSWEEKMGWERVRWFAIPEDSDVEHDTFSRPRWIRCLHHEMTSCQTAAALFDLTSFAKFELMGFDALCLLQSLCCSDVNIPVGSVVNTLMLNETGGCEVQCDVVRLDENRYLVMSEPEQATILYHWMRKHNTSVSICDITGGLSVIRLLGPRVNEMLMDCASLSTASGDIERDQWLGHAPALLVERNDFIMKGVDVFVSNDYALHVYDLLVEQGNAYNLVNGGMVTLDWLRVENGQCKWGQELDAYTTPLDVGLDHLIDWKKDFIGHSALAAQKKRGVNKQMVKLTLLDPSNSVMAWGAEPIVRNGSVAGLTTSAFIDAQSKQVVCLGLISCPLNDETVSDDLLAVQVAGNMYSTVIC